LLDRSHLRKQVNTMRDRDGGGWDMKVGGDSRSISILFVMGKK
jgi:hypothetical protein